MTTSPAPAQAPAPAPGPRAPLKPLDEALAELLVQAQASAGTETVSTFEADGRVLAQDVVSELHVPPQDNSAMDGYAVRASDVAQPGVVLQVTQRIPAGTAGRQLEALAAARIFTGAPVPPGADAIVMQEDATLLTVAEGNPSGSASGGEHRENPASGVRINAVPALGQWIRRAGEDVARGDVVLRAGQRLGPAELGLAASVGMGVLQVAARPRVALFSTGDELVMPGTVPPAQMPPGAIYNSNRFFLRALLERLGCAVTDFGIVPDQREATVQALRGAAIDHDLILTSGGVSVGEEDHIKPAVQQLGSLNLWQIAIKPGKPFAYGTIRRDNAAGQAGVAHFMGLPGNPVSSFVTFLLLVRPFLLKMQGVLALSPSALSMPAHFDWPRPDKRREFLRVRRNGTGGLDLYQNQSSGVLTSAVWADGLVDNPPGQAIRQGDLVRFVPLSDLL
jgi:molybdopterin molybdotransferase